MNSKNPWTPTTTPVADVASPTPPMRKPASIWLLQIVSALAALIFLHSAYTTFSVWRTTSPGEIVRVAYVASLVLHLLFISLLVVTIIAAQRRLPFARWLGAILMLSLVGIVLYGFMTNPPGAQESVPEAVGVYSFISIFLVLPPLLIWFATFSKAARAWYARS